MPSEVPQVRDMWNEQRGVTILQKAIRLSKDSLKIKKTQKTVDTD